MEDDRLLAKLDGVLSTSLENQSGVNDLHKERLDAHGAIQRLHGERLSAIEGETGATREMVTTLLQRIPKNGNGGGRRSMKADAALIGGSGVGLAGLWEILQRLISG